MLPVRLCGISCNMLPVRVCGTPCNMLPVRLCGTPCNMLPVHLCGTPCMQEYGGPTRVALRYTSPCVEEMFRGFIMTVTPWNSATFHWAKHNKITVKPVR